LYKILGALVKTIREILGGYVAWVDFGVFVDGLFSLRLDQSGWL